MDAQRRGGRDVAANNKNRHHDEDDKHAHASTADDKIRLPPISSLSSPPKHHLSPVATTSGPPRLGVFSSRALTPLESRGLPVASNPAIGLQQSYASGSRRALSPPLQRIDLEHAHAEPNVGFDQHHHLHHHHHHHHHDDHSGRQRAYSRLSDDARRQFQSAHSTTSLMSTSSSSSSPRQEGESRWPAAGQRYERAESYDVHNRSRPKSDERFARWPFSMPSSSAKWSSAHQGHYASSSSSSGAATRSYPSGPDPYAGRESETPATSSSAQWPAHHARSHVRWIATPYDKASYDLRIETFRQLWDIFLAARRYSDNARASTLLTSGPRPLPSIAEGDLETLSTHLQYEVDLLFEGEPHTAEHLAHSARALQMQFHERKRHAFQSTAALPHARQPAQHSTASSSMPDEHELMEARAVRRHPQSDHSGRSGASVDYRTGGGGEYGLERPSLTSATNVSRSFESESSSHSFFSLQRSPQPHMPPTSSAVNIAHGYAYPYTYPLATSSGAVDLTGTASGLATNPAPTVPPPPNVPRRVRKRHDEQDQSCLCCSASETPEWRKGPTGPRTLCNACGLLYAKQVRKREAELQVRGKRTKGTRSGGASSGYEDMTAEEQQASLLELRMAVQVRSSQTNNPRRTSATPIDGDDGDSGGRGSAAG